MKRMSCNWRNFFFSWETNCYWSLKWNHLERKVELMFSHLLESSICVEIFGHLQNSYPLNPIIMSWEWEKSMGWREKDDKHHISLGTSVVYFMCHHWSFTYHVTVSVKIIGRKENFFTPLVFTHCWKWPEEKKWDFSMSPLGEV